MNKQEAHWPHRPPEKPVQIKKHICAKLLPDRQTGWNQYIPPPNEVWGGGGGIKIFVHRYDYIIMFIGRVKPIFSFLRIEWSLFVKPRVPLTQGCFVPNLVEPGPIGGKYFQISSMYFLYCIIIFPWKSVWNLIWTNLNPGAITLGCFVPDLVEIGRVFLEKKIFKIG